ncbi:MAG: SGNH/GDSL hydrolase family protein [Planctomycetota bacterium]|jgi:acyl-CoA thioesterase-1
MGRGITCCAALALTVACTSAAARSDDEAGGAGEPLKVLLIGDSISRGYHPTVARVLAGKADVRHMGSGRDTGYTLARVERWLGDVEWDVIHFNWGLWDCRHTVNEDGTLSYAVPLAEYESNLRKLIGIMEATGARLIWASTTPVLWDEPGLGRTDPDVRRYNEAAARIMAAKGIATDDLYGLVKPRLHELQSKAYDSDVHYTAEGYRVLGRAVARAIVAEPATASGSTPGPGWPNAVWIAVGITIAVVLALAACVRSLRRKRGE